MTSPFTKPGATQDKYQDVYSKGGTYGSDLRSEADVRRLLKTEIRSPFAKAVQDVVNAVEGVVSDIASAIRGEGARYEVINVAVTERLGPINTLITQTGARHKELADKVDRSIEKQAGINQEQAKTIKEAGDAVQALKDYQAEIQAKVQSSIDTAKSATSEASVLRGELTKLANSTNSKIGQVSDKAKAVESKFNKLNNEFGSRVDSAIANSPKVKETSERASQALDALMNPIDVGTSLVTVNPITKVPYWAENATESKNIAPPIEGAKVYSNRDKKGTSGTTPTWGGMVTVDPRLEYEASFWLRIGTKGVRTVIELRDQDANHAVSKSTSFDDSKAKYSGANYVWWTPENLNPGWYFIRQKLLLKENVSQAKLATIYWHHQDGAYGTASICNLSISPVIPTQASVDAAQNKAIKALETATSANTLSLANQKKINEESARWRVETEDWKAKKDQFQKTTEQFQKTQAKVEELQTKTDDAQNDALTALNKPEMADSLVPMVPNNGRISGVGKYDWIPEYATFDSSATAFSGGVYLQSTSQSQTAIRGVPVKVEPGGTYKVELTAAAGVSGSVMYLELRDSNDKSHAIESSTYFTVKGDSTKYGDGGKYVISNLELKRGTWTYTGYITIRKDVEYAQLWNLYWNHPRSTATGTQRLESLKIYRHVPSQAEIDELQNKAIEQSQKFQIEQERINRLVQEQLWNHQDTMEFLDIRAPKTYGYNIAKGKGTSWTKTTIPYKSYSSSSGSYNASGFYNKEVSPFVTVLTEQGDKTAWVVCKGKWEGSFNISLNWTNGAVDNWSIDLKSTGARVFQFTGGAATIHLRQITVTVFANCLNREMTMKLASFNKVGDAGTLKGDTSLFRGVVKTDRPNSFRLKAPVSCDRNLDYLDENGNWKTLSAGTTFSGKTVALPSSTRTLSFYEKWEYGGEWDKPSGNDWDSHNGNTSVDKFQAN